MNWKKKFEGIEVGDLVLFHYTSSSIFWVKILEIYDNGKFRGNIADSPERAQAEEWFATDIDSYNLEDCTKMEI